MAFWSAVVGLGRKIQNPKGPLTITNASVTESKKGAKKGAVEGDVAEVRIKTKNSGLMTVCGFVPEMGVRSAPLNITLTAEEVGKLVYAGSGSWEVHLIGRYVDAGSDVVLNASKAQKKTIAVTQAAPPPAKSSKTDIKNMDSSRPRIQDLLDMEAGEDSENESDEDDGEEEEDEEDAENPEELAIIESVNEKIRNASNLSISRPNANGFTHDEEEDDSEADSELADFIVNDDEDVGDEEDTTEDDDDDEEEEEVIADPRAGQKKSQLQNNGGPKAKVQKLDVSKTSKVAAPAESTPRKSVASAPATPHKSPAAKKVVTKNGVVIEEVKSGNGPIAKRGKKVTVYYTGKLKSSNKKFDSNTSGRGFTFKLGAGEVIKGWDIGVEGMRVGEHRKIQIPPNMGYGKNGAAPDIPPNAALVFDVELRNVK